MLWCDSLAAMRAQEEFTEQAVVPIKVLPHGEAHRTFVVLARPEGSVALGRFVNVLRFTVKEIDPSTGALRDPRSRHDCHQPTTRLTKLVYLLRTLLCSGAEVTKPQPYTAVSGSTMCL